MADLSVVRWHYMWLKTVAYYWQYGTAFSDTIVGKSPEEVRKGICNAASVPVDQWPFIEDYVKVYVDKPEKPAQWLSSARFWSLENTKINILLPNPPKQPDLTKPDTDPPIAWAIANIAECMSKLVRYVPITLAQLDRKQGTRGTESDCKPQDLKVLAAESTQIGFEQMYRWFTVWPHAVAHAWRDPLFRKHLTDSPRVALFNAFGFEVPAGANLTITDQVSTGVYTKDLGTPIDIHMSLPEKPPSVAIKNPVNNQPDIPTNLDDAIALAAYAESGRTFPFTLCAAVC